VTPSAIIVTMPALLDEGQPKFSSQLGMCAPGVDCVLTISLKGSLLGNN